MIYNVLHNMLRAKNPPLSFSPSRVRIGQLAVPVYSTITCLLAPHHQRGSCHISGGAHRRARLGGRGCVDAVEEERWPRQPLLPRRSWVDNWHLALNVRRASCAQRTKGLAGFVVDSIQRCSSAPSESADAV
jgi:hypothetical protein